MVNSINLDIAKMVIRLSGSWGLLETDEMTLCAYFLDTLQGHLGERPCCVWKKHKGLLEKYCERGEIRADLDEKSFAGAMNQNPPPGEWMVQTPSPLPAYKAYWHIPLHVQDRFLGVLSLAVFEREDDSEGRADWLRSLAALLSVSFCQTQENRKAAERENQMQLELESAVIELDSANEQLAKQMGELKLLQAEVERRVGELTAANKSKDEFLSIVSHELRTPLTTMTGFLGVVLDQEAGPVNEQQQKFLRIANQSANRLSMNIQSGQLSLHMGICAVGEIIKRSVDLVRPQAEAKNIRMSLRLPENNLEAWGDAQRLSQVLDNLLSNAVKFTDRDGSIDVYLEEKGDFLQIYVKDTGPGLSLEEQAKVFDVFYQVDASSRRSASGTGLGLAIVRGIIAMHGGQVFLDSEKGKGSTFSFLVPRKKARRMAA
jgi:signal transduction histidine kinase